MMSTDNPPSPPKDDYQIHLNFLPVEMSTTPCLILSPSLCICPRRSPTPLHSSQIAIGFSR